MAWFALALAIAGCIGVDRGGAYACRSFDDCGPAQSCTAPAGTSLVCVDVAPLAAGATSYGKTQTQWAVAWVQWLEGLPAHDHPLYDSDGTFCGAGEQGGIFYLAGDDVAGGGANTRSCTIPVHQPLVFPVFWWLADNNQRADPSTEDALRTEAFAAVDGAHDLVLQIDDRAFTPAEIQALRLKGEVKLSYSLDRADPLARPLDGQPYDISPAFLAGFFVVLPPPPPGPHTIRFGASFVDVNGEPNSVDSTYHLEVQ